MLGLAIWPDGNSIAAVNSGSTKGLYQIKFANPNTIIRLDNAGLMTAASGLVLDATATYAYISGGSTGIIYIVQLSNGNVTVLTNQLGLSWGMTSDASKTQ